ncbi:MAG: ShlB/FhaC/HecB family hemolysin secretion/activation protein [Cyanobacteria bacterium SID2]|nr:ShlB/FhaC/HecB family hemolysin secretion/activation protein [Cyanobacteria bacterium SID2]MBP0006704.1 ShlB/FhaC/HecB family hemolysin secretion/activation protein [Cyanobacteria bacterium SBC]
MLWGAKPLPSIHLFPQTLAQSVPPVSPDLSPLPDRLPQDEPVLDPPSLELPERSQPSSTGSIEVRDVRVLGNTVFSDADIAAIVAPYLGRSVTFEELIALRTAITDLYVSNGYITSGAFLPPQDVTDGIILVQVVEGQLESIELEGLKRLSEGYVRNRILRVSDPPLNLAELEAALQLLQNDPAIETIRAELTAGSAPGLSVLRLSLEEVFPVNVSLWVENRDAPSVGSIRGSVGVQVNSPLGIGDRLLGELGITSGVTEVFFDYTVPLNANNTKLRAFYERAGSRIVEEPFDRLDIRSTEEHISFGILHPVVETSQEEFTLGASLDLLRSRTFIFDDEPFSFSEGPEDGRSSVTALRLMQEWTRRSQRDVLAARSQVSFGLDLFNATSNDDAPDGAFLTWLGQFQWVRALSPETLLIARIATQLSTDELLPIEQFSIGGIDTVRGYLQNQRVGDSGIVGSLELRFPVVRDPGGWGTIQLTPFFDVGTVWSLGDREIPSPSTLVGTGLGLRWELSEDFSAAVTWGIPLVSIDDRGDSLQGDGIYFLIRYNPF